MSDASRRKLLKSIAAGSGAIVAGKSLPDSWSRPVVDSVILPAHAQTSLAAPGSQVFVFTGADQPFTVPAGVTSISITALGASGGNGAGAGVGGLGGQASGILTVTPGETLNVYVGGAGQDDAPSGTTGGFNGGGDRAPTCAAAGAGAGTGGGASDVRQGGNTLANRVIVAAGGGGAYDDSNGGAGGGLTGDSADVYIVLTPATGGTQSAGGVAGQSLGQVGCISGTAGSLGQGGTGESNDGGGGGGGYYGGGGGSDNGGGGGGSSYIGGVASGATTSGTNTGAGQVTLTW